MIQLDYPDPWKGKPVDELLAKLCERLQKNRSVALVLDEFDQLEAASEIIYDLALISQETTNHLGQVLISNRPPEKLYLDPRSQSRLRCETLRFDPYDVDQLVGVLDDRTDYAFQPGAVSEAAIEFLAHRIAKRSGDCRDALRILVQAARSAGRASDRKLNIEHLKGELE